MYIKQDMGFNDLMNNCWSGALDTLITIEEHDKEEELMEFLINEFTGIPELTEINDLLWFESDFVFETLGISESEDKEEEENVWEENEIDFSQHADFDSFCGGRDCNTCPFFHYVMENKDFDCEEYFNKKYKK